MYSSMELFKINDMSRSIFLFDVIEKHNADSIISSLMRMNKDSEIEPINLFINSPGGSVTSALGIVDTMNIVKAPINTFIIGTAYSAASMIASSGNKRFATENSSVMFHEGSTRLEGKTSEMAESLEAMKDMQDKMFNVLAKTSGKSLEEINELAEKTDVFMSSTEAVAFGLIDTILTEEQFASIKLSEKIESSNLELGEDLKTIHLLQVGEHKTSKYGSLNITSEMINTLKSNFDSNIRGQEISIDFTHDNDNGEKKAGAWIKELTIENNGLYAKVEYTPSAKKMVENKEYKYVSAEFVLNYITSDTGKSVPYVLFGGTFTNRPALKGLETLKLSEKNEVTMDLKAIKSELKSVHNIDVEALLKAKTLNIKLSEEKTALESEKVKLEAEKEVLETEKKEAVEKKDEVETEIKEIKKEAIATEKEIEVIALISKGIVLTAQKERILNSFESAKSIRDFYKDIPAVLSVEAKGVDANDKDITAEKKKEFARQTGLSVEDCDKYGNK